MPKVGEKLSRGDRFKELRATLGLSQQAIAEKFGISKPSWQRYESGTDVPNGTILSAIADNSDFSVHWLLTGEGPKLYSEFPDEFREAGFVKIPRYEAVASAGPGAISYSEERLEFKAFDKEWIRTELRRNPENLALITARGDSMEPEIRNGQTLLVDVADREPVRDGIYVFRVEDAVQVKRIQRAMTGEIVLKSDNRSYSEEVLTPRQAKSLHIIGRVVWYGKKLL